MKNIKTEILKAIGEVILWLLAGFGLGFVLWKIFN
jgi:hypothetical protein